MVRRIKLMPDYEADPVWSDDPDDPGCGCMIELEELPISAELRDRLRRWADAYELNDDWMGVKPADSPWTPQFAAEFEAEGRQLWLLLRAELGPTWRVAYFSEERMKKFDMPEELAAAERTPEQLAP
jgi:hypothetical protein